MASIATQNPDKLITLTNYVSPEVYVHIQDAATYDSAIATLKAPMSDRKMRFTTGMSLQAVGRERVNH